MSEFPTTIKKLRLNKKLSQKQIATELGYAQSTYCDWENGKIEPTASALIAIAKLFNTSVDSLLGLQYKKNTTCIKNNYGESLRNIRLQKGKTLKQLSEETNISFQNLSRWERGEVLPSIDFCLKLADYYQISIDELIDRSFDKN